MTGKIEAVEVVMIKTRVECTPGDLAFSKDGVPIAVCVHTEASGLRTDVYSFLPFVDAINEVEALSNKLPCKSIRVKGSFGRFPDELIECLPEDYRASVIVLKDEDELKAGDCILEIDGEPVKDYADGLFRLQNPKPNKEAAVLKVMRGDSMKVITVSLTEFETERVALYGMVFDWVESPIKGFQISCLFPDSPFVDNFFPAHDSVFALNDIIVEINERPLQDLSSKEILVSALSAVARQGPTPRLTVLRVRDKGNVVIKGSLGCSRSG